MARLLPLAEIRLNAQGFAASWVGVGSERAESQSFWNDLLGVYGVSRRHRGVLFERPARRASTGKTGFIDVFWPQVMLAEQKSGGKLLTPEDGGPSNAETQAFDYLNGGDITEAEFPRWVVTSDFHTIQVTDLTIARGDAGRTITFATTDLPDHVEDLAFLAGYEARSFWARHQEAASVEAATLMAALYVAATGDASQDETVSAEDEDEISFEASLMMTRLLFLLFGDDASLWERGAFTRFLHERTSEDGSDLGSQLQALYDLLDTPEGRRNRLLDDALRPFPFVNGGLFGDRRPVQYFDRTMRDALLKACEFDWTSISPAVFGSLFQSIKSRDARRAGGEHYTSEQNILKTLGPLFLDNYKGQVTAARGKSDERRRLRELWSSFRDLRYLDPAAGCGNFLLVAYREMRQIELDVILRLRDLDSKSGGESQLAFDELVTEGLLVSLDQFHGIELNWWPAKIAEVAMYLVDHQCNRRMSAALGDAPRRFPIKISAQIHHANALTDDWANLTQISAEHPVWLFGNPPYAGHETRSEEQTAELRELWGGADIGRLDFVAAWHQQAVQFFDGRPGEFAFVTTNSIAQGDQAPRLMRLLIEHGWMIKFAHRTFRWTTEVIAKDRAVVFVIIVGYTRQAAGNRVLFDYATPQAKFSQVLTVPAINEYLVEGEPLLLTPRRTPLVPDLPKALFGNMPRDGGNLLITEDEYPFVTADSVAATYVHPFVGADEMLYNNKRWCLWLTDLDPTDLNRSPVLRERLRLVAQFRSSEPKKAGRRRSASTRKMAETPQLFGQRAQAKTELAGVTVIPRHVGEFRRFFTVAHYPAGTIVGDSAFFADDPDGLLFALISSSMFITWQRTVGGAIKGDLRFANTLTWNNFPVPEITDDLRRRIIAAGQGVLKARALHPDRSLVEHYNPLAMDPALLRAHAVLDRHVDRAFGAARTCGTERERQLLLFASYRELNADLLTSEAGRTRRRRATR